MKQVEYLEPVSMQGVFAALGAEDARACLISGGSDLLGQLKEGIAGYDRLVSLSGIESLRRIEPTDSGLSIGAMVTLSQMEYSSLLTGPYQMLAEAARSVATPEVRNQGTLGGNLCQRPRCLHYRNKLVPCLKKGGDGCPAIETPYQAYLSLMGSAGGCYAVHASDLAPPLIALDAVAVIEGAAGRREVPLSQFFTSDDPQRENVLEAGEVLTAVAIPQAPAAWRGVYSKGRERTAGDFAVVSVALGFQLTSGRIQAPRVILGGVAPTPLRSYEAERILEGREPNAIAGTLSAAVALADTQPLSHNAYKQDLAQALISRAVLRVGQLQA